MKTESEARECWCPAARVIAPIGDGTDWFIGNRGNDQDATPHTRCIASRCMAWRWVPTAAQFVNGDQGIVGFCGLAGRP